MTHTFRVFIWLTQLLLSYTDPMVDMMFMIQKGVTLRKIERTASGDPKPIGPPSDSHTQQLKAALERITLKLNTPFDDELSEEEEQDFDD